MRLPFLLTFGVLNVRTFVIVSAAVVLSALITSAAAWVAFTARDGLAIYITHACQVEAGCHMRK
jgi:hypothetical protein